MPAHGHGTSPQFTDGVESTETPGTYSLSDMDLFMAGVWMIAIEMSTPEGVADEVVFHFMLEG